MDLDTLQPSEPDLRARALQRLAKKREFWSHLAVYLAVNSLLVAVWFLTSSGFFWPIIPAGAWGIGLAAHAVDTFTGEPSEERIQREMRRIR
jgi:hypothetical protein